MALINRFKDAWDAFRQRAPAYIGSGNGSRPDRTRYTRGQEKTFINSIYTRLALDVVSLNILHCVVNEDDGYLKTVPSDLNNCLTREANIDQSGKAFLLDICLSMFDEGVVAAAPILTSGDINDSSSYKIYTMRTGKIVDWYPQHVRINIYNDRKLNLIVSLPYLARTAARKKLVEDRMREMDDQLSNSSHGILYTDGTEKVTQLNRPLENTILASIEYYQKQAYSQLGLTDEIMAGTADADVMENYYSRTIELIATAITTELERKFITKTAYTQGQRIKFFRDPFKLAPASKIAEMSDKFKRNEIMSTDEVRQKIGLRPIGTEQTTSLRNPNISPADGQEFSTTNGAGVTVTENGGEDSGFK